MDRNCLRASRLGLLAAGLMALSLTGCSTAYLGGASAFGGKEPSVSEIASIESYPADRALSEARGHFRNNNFGYSAALYQRVVELSPQDPQGYVGLSASYDRLGRFDLSDRVYAALFDLSGGTAQYYNNVGYSYMLRGDLSGALANFRKASKLAPDNVVVANNLQMLARTAAQARG